MNEHETMETSVVTMEDSSAAEQADVAAAEEPAVGSEALPAGPATDLAAEAEALKAVYPDFDLAAEMDHPVLGALLRGERNPTLRQLYEAVHWEDVTAKRVRTEVESAVGKAVEEAVALAVTEAVKESEARLLSNIRARGLRPSENGVSAAVGIRMHPAVDRLTRRERAMLAKRAENGETIKF